MHLKVKIRRQWERLPKRKYVRSEKHVLFGAGDAPAGRVFCSFNYALKRNSGDKNALLMPPVPAL